MDMESLLLNGSISNLSTTNGYMNGTYSPDDTMDMSKDNDQTVSQQQKLGSSPPTYADAFPPLSAAPKSNVGATQTAWVSKNTTKPKPAAETFRPILSSTATQVFKIPYEERKFKSSSPIVGDADRQNELIRDIMQRTGTTIEVSVNKDQCLTVMVTGKRDATAQAKRFIIAGLQTQASIEIEIPKEHHGFVLGKGGKKLQELELMTQTKITIPRDSKIIRIVGTKEGIDRAKHEIQLISDEQAKLAFERLTVPKIYHPFIQGPDNEKMKEIALSTGARINIPPPSVNKDEITVAGDKESVQKAVKLIMDIYKRREKLSKTVAIEVKKNQHRYVIGPKGSGIQDILRATGVSVEVPSSDSDNETIILRGDGDKLGNALTMVYEKANSCITAELHAPKWLHRFIIGRKGENIKKITQDLDNKIHIEFVEDKDKIFIEGPPNEVNAAENLLELSLNELKNTMSFADIQVDQKWHRHIIGKNGANITKIKNETGTSINIPLDTKKSNIIHIEGSPQGVAAAKEEILEMAAKMDNEKSKDIIIEQRFHKNIIGQKGENVRVIREKFADVQISFPEAGKKSDIVTLRGPKEEVDQCYNYMKKLVQDVVASNYRCEVPIIKKFHGNIIGRNGANIKKIKEETNTTIEIPPVTSNSDVIIVTGYKEQAEKAKKMILAIQNELASVVSVEVKVPQKLHMAMIGPGGKLIQSIMNECGDVNIRFPSEDAKSDIIVIRGAKEDVEKAEIQLKKLAEERQENNYTAEVTAKAEHHRFLIGKGGVNIRKVREKTGARIIFPTKNDENKELITIIGTKESVEEAKADLLNKIKDLNNIVESEVLIDPKHHRELVARRAQILRDIADEYGGVTVSLPKVPDSNKVSLKGAKECVEGAKQRLLEIVNDLESMVEKECIISHVHHRAVLGNKGKNVQELSSKLGVQIKFPERRPVNSEAAASEGDDSKLDVIVISGKKDDVEEACNTLLSLVPISEKIQIPFDNHRYIIGTKGAGIRKMMEEYDVNIAVPSADLQDDHIVVTGPVANVKNALDALRKRNAEIESENEDRKLRQFEMVVNVPKAYHSKLIGRKGAMIQKLRDEYGVNIRVPPASNTPDDDEQANQIHLIGYEDKCIKAKEAIEAIIKEVQDQVSIEVMIDSRIHSRIIGQKGRSVRKIMEKFKVDIRFPRQENPNLVVISGDEESCEACKEHLQLLEEEYMDTVHEREEEQELMASYLKPRSGKEKENNQEGFVVKGAPWEPQKCVYQQKEYTADAVSDFPTLTSIAAGGQQSKAWGKSSGF